MDSLLGKGFKSSKCKTQLRLATARIKLLRNKRDIQIKSLRRDIAQLLSSGQESSARIRVEHVMREQNVLDAYDVIELFSDLVAVRLPIIEGQKTCPVDLKEAISSLIYASPRCADLPELIQIRTLFTAKYGKEFVASATELRPDCGVNRRVIEKLSVKAPSGEAKLKLMKEIAAEHNVDWDPAVSEKELTKVHEDLLHGPTHFISANEMPIPSRPVPTRIASQGGHPPSRASEPSSTNPTPLPHVPVPYVHVKTPQSGKYEETAPSIPDYQGQPPHAGKYDTPPRDTRLNDAPPPEPSRWESERLTPQVAQLPHDYIENPRRYSTGFAGDAGLGRREGYFEENSIGPPQRARGEFSSRFQPTHGRNQNSSEELRRASIGVPRDAYAQVGWASQPDYPDVNSAAQAASASADRAVAAARAAAALAKNNKYGNIQSSDSSVQRNAQVPNHNTAAHDTDEYTSLSEDDYGVQSHAMGNRANGMASVREGEDSDETEEEEEEEVVLPYKERVTRQPGTGLIKPKSTNGNNWNSEFQKSHGSDGEDSKEGSRGRLTGRRKEKHPVVDDVDRHSHRSPEFEKNYAGDIRPRSLPEKKSKPPVEDYDKRDRRHSQNFEYEEQVERARVVKEAPAGRWTRSKPVADEYVNRDRRQSGAGEENERAPPRKGKPKPSDIRTSKSEPQGSPAFDDEEGSRGKVTSRKNSRLVAEGYAEEYRTSASHGFDKERDQVRKWDEVPSKGFRSKGKPLHDEVPEVVRTSNTDYHESVSGRSWEESGLSYKDNIRRSKSDGKPGKAKTSFQENGYKKSDYQSHGSEDDAILPSGRDLHWTKSADDYQSGDLRRSNKSEEYDDEEGPLGRGPDGRMLKPRENEHQDSDSRQLHGYDDEYRSPTEASRKSRKGMKNSQLDDSDMVEPKIFSAPALLDEPEDTNFLGSLKEEKVRIQNPLSPIFTKMKVSVSMTTQALPQA